MTSPPVQRQITLPLSKAAEIAYKSIRLRLGRSVVVISGIVLALAFLMSILVSEAIVDGVRGWIGAANGSPEFVELRRRQGIVDQQLLAHVARLHTVATQHAAAPAGPGALRASTGADADALRKELGGLPLGNDDMARVAAAEPAAVNSWAEAVRQSHALRLQLTAPQRLEAQMKSAGVPSTPKEIANGRAQKRLLVGLSLLVAFVGILNAMLMSVTERFREIGTMKCLGALDSFIIKLFLIESLFQGVVGTCIGVTLGLGLSLISGVAAYGGYAYINLPMGELAVKFGVCTLIGLGLTVAGAVYPAWQAARMQPIEAMRVDA